jgi:hypothetical protein
MKKIELDSDDFKEMYEKGIDGIVVFIMNDCHLCIDHINRLERSNISKFYVVNCLEDTNHYMMEMKLDDMPYTILYKNSEIKYEKGGVLFDKQQRELKEVENDHIN